MQTLERLKTRGLVASKSDYLAVDALYNLMKELYVVPTWNSKCNKKVYVVHFPACR